jgi:hypothetical protein
MTIPPAPPLAPSRRRVLLTAAAVVAIPATTSLAANEVASVTQPSETQPRSEDHGHDHH